MPGKVVMPLRLGRSVAMRVDVRAVVVCGLLGVGVLGVGVLAIGTGDYTLSPREVIETLLGDGPPGASFIVERLRLPRAVCGLLVGASLGVAGGIFQSLSRNPLGSPDIIGFTNGAATAAVIAILLFGAGADLTAVAAIVGGLVTALVVYLLALGRGPGGGAGGQGYRLVLVGIGVSATLAGITAYLLARAEQEQAVAATVWLVGSLNGRGWEQVRPVALALVVLLPVALALARPLRMMEMGDEPAAALGVRVERTRIVLVLVGVGLTGVATAASGTIGFVALAAPQLARRLTRTTGPGLVSAALMGAFVLAVSDLVAQRAFAPTQLPVGVATASVGGLYLVWLLSREWRAHRG
ncbi:iron chelate uptake ABC transporter family permease subunit [Frankia sp. AgPm24]|uniref:FecCD family ABC transporter permease n=1 Tax=Frankia sp. AgPm24 TaxID=631128 RepID=UPI00200E97C1|nr:iron chelate uptake ABC transporter family permease subunit [Frankia sp. AgPm24]MCK9920724.1 iron chelate uptake ABC transporter family permease subunit [Frankia sp. AgPm24]